MKIIKTYIILFFSIIFFFNACTSVKEGLSGERKKGTDEFLVEKKSPLVLPPSFGELPEPKNTENKNKKAKHENDFNLKELISKNSVKNKNASNNSLDTTVESLIIKKINKN